MNKHWTPTPEVQGRWTSARWTSVTTMASGLPSLPHLRVKSIRAETSFVYLCIPSPSQRCPIDFCRIN